MTMIDFRKLKIHTKYRNRKYDETKIPEIRLEGKWLESRGFKRGQTVKIKQQKNKLTITIVGD
jgi:toxic protein SymE